MSNRMFFLLNEKMFFSEKSIILHKVVHKSDIRIFKKTGSSVTESPAFFKYVLLIKFMPYEEHILIIFI